MMWNNTNKCEVGEMINKDMNIMDIIIKYPETRAVFQKYNMACSSCMGAIDETLEAGAKMHGIELDKLIVDLNTVIVK